MEYPEHIGRVAGCGRIAGGVLIKFPPLMWGKSPCGLHCVRYSICSSDSFIVVVVESYCILINIIVDILETGHRVSSRRIA